MATASASYISSVETLFVQLFFEGTLTVGPSAQLPFVLFRSICSFSFISHILQACCRMYSCSMCTVDTMLVSYCMNNLVHSAGFKVI